MPGAILFSVSAPHSQARNDSMEFGNAIHQALQRYFNEVRETEIFRPEKLVQPFRLYMQQHREAFTDKQFRNRMELGEMILPEYYAQHVSSWNKVVVTEYPVRDVTWKNIPINGKLDKIEFNGNEVHGWTIRQVKLQAGQTKNERANR